MLYLSFLNGVFRLLEIWNYKLELMAIYECTMVDTEREPTPNVRCANVEMVDTKREPSLDVRCTNVEQHIMDAGEINLR